jgi:hypothetical protein
MVIFMLWLLYPHEKSTWYSLAKGLRESQRGSECYGEEKDLFPWSGIEPQFFGCPACGLVAVLTEIFWQL